MHFSVWTVWVRPPVRTLFSLSAYSKYGFFAVTGRFLDLQVGVEMKRIWESLTIPPDGSNGSKWPGHRFLFPRIIPLGWLLLMASTHAHFPGCYCFPLGVRLEKEKVFNSTSLMHSISRQADKVWNQHNEGLTEKLNLITTKHQIPLSSFTTIQTSLINAVGEEDEGYWSFVLFCFLFWSNLHKTVNILRLVIRTS